MGCWAGLFELIDFKGMKLRVGEFFAWFLAKTRGSKSPAFCLWSYQYLSLKNATWDENTNIFPGISQESIARINLGIANDDIDRLLDDIKLSLLTGAAVQMSRCSRFKRIIMNGEYRIVLRFRGLSRTG